MVVRIPFTVGAITKEFTHLMEKGINDALADRDEYVKTISPVDSGDYIDSHGVTEAVTINNQVAGANFNDSEHAYGVEFGFTKSPVNWTDKGGRAVAQNPVTGAHPMQRMTDDKAKDVTKFIANAINKG